MKYVKLQDKKIYVIAIIIVITMIVAGLMYVKYRTANTYIFPNDIMILHDGIYDEQTDTIISNGNIDTSIVRTQAFSLRRGSYIVTISYKSDVDAKVDVRGNNSVNFTFDLPASQGNIVEVSDSRLNLVSSTEKAFISVVSKEQAGDFELYYIKLSSDVAIYRDWLLNCAAVIFIGILLSTVYFFKDRISISRKQWIEILLMTFIVIVTMVLNYSTEIRRAVDIRCHLLRINGIFTGIEDRQFPVIIYPNQCNEYGEMGILYPNVLLYFPAILRVFGVSLKTAYIYYAIFINSITMAFAYIGFKKISDSDNIGTITAIMYYLMPNRMRFNLSWGSVGGAGTAMAFLPLAIAGLYCLLKKREDRVDFLMLPIGLWGMFTSHIVSTLVAILILTIVSLFHIREIFDKSCLIKLCISVVIFIVISLGSIVPFLDNYFEGFNNEALAWGGYSTFMGEFDRTFTEISCVYRIVDMVLVIIVIALFIMNARRISNDADKKFYICFGIMAAISVLFITRIIPWKYLFSVGFIGSFLGETIQYPDRFLTITEPALVICFVLIFKWIDADWVIKGLVSLSAMAVICGCFVDYYSYYTYGEKMLYDSVSGEIDWHFDDYLPKGTEREWYQTDTGNFSNYDTINIASHSKIWTHISTEYTCSTDGEYLEYPLFYYKNYEAYDQDMKPVRVEKGDRNYVRVYLDKCDDVHTINLMYKVKMLYKISALISIVLFVILMGYLVMYRKCTLIAKIGGNDRKVENKVL